jgi:hypothetical protein
LEALDLSRHVDLILIENQISFESCLLVENVAALVAQKEAER